MKNKEIKINTSFTLFSLIRRGLGIIVIVILVSMFLSTRHSYKEQLQLNNALNDSLILERNERGELTATIQAYQTQRADDFLAFKTKDSLTLELQKEVRSMKKYLKKQGSVSQFSTQTGLVTSSKTEVVSNNKNPSFPTYKSNFDLDGWVFGKSIATKDSTYLDLKIKDEFSLTIGVEPTGFLGMGKGKPFGQIKSKNPFSSVKSFKTYNVGRYKEPNLVIGPSVGVNFNGRPVVGFTATYALLKFKL